MIINFFIILLIIISMALTSMSRNLLLEHIKDMCLQIDYIAGVMLLLHGSTRNVNAETFSGWIINIAAENGPFFDVVPTQVGGSDSTHYSDYYSRTSDSSLVLARSGYRSYPTGGVAYTDAAYDASDMDSSYGLRYLLS